MSFFFVFAVSSDRVFAKYYQHTHDCFLFSHRFSNDGYILIGYRVVTRGGAGGRVGVEHNPSAMARVHFRLGRTIQERQQDCLTCNLAACKFRESFVLVARDLMTPSRWLRDR